tara:strand:- start:3317 stop:3595 length:279 start_codon:yes stop_codon:yes gene_type:complete
MYKIATKDCCTIGSCPFSFTDESEKAQNYGCLPTPCNILHMRNEHGKTWACHSNPDKPCRGALKMLHKLGKDATIIDKDLLTYTCEWEKYCE